MRKLRNSKSSGAEACRAEARCNHSSDFLPDAQHLSAVDESAFTDALSEAAWSRTKPLVQRHTVAYSGLSVIHLYGGYSSECIQGTKLPSPIEKEIERLCIIQNDSACDLAISTANGVQKQKLGNKLALNSAH